MRSLDQVKSPAAKKSSLLISYFSLRSVLNFIPECGPLEAYECLTSSAQPWLIPSGDLWFLSFLIFLPEDDNLMAEDF